MIKWESQLRKGVVELAVLGVIAGGETYGYEIVDRLRGLKGLEFTESTVYPVLSRLTGEEALVVRTAASPSGPSRRYYRLSSEGRQRLAELSAVWRTVSESLTSLLEGADG